MRNGGSVKLRSKVVVIMIGKQLKPLFNML